MRRTLVGLAAAVALFGAVASQAQSAKTNSLSVNVQLTGRGITVERVLTDNGSCFRSRDWRDALAAAGSTHKRTRPYRPQTNAKVERGFYPDLGFLGPLV